MWSSSSLKDVLCGVLYCLWYLKSHLDRMNELHLGGCPRSPSLSRPHGQRWLWHAADGQLYTDVLPPCWGGRGLLVCTPLSFLPTQRIPHCQQYAQDRTYLEACLISFFFGSIKRCSRYRTTVLLHHGSPRVRCKNMGSVVCYCIVTSLLGISGV